jgi:ABC-type nitrate/sulfonate/bicarbonate transport system substrate-binding protein
MGAAISNKIPALKLHAQSHPRPLRFCAIQLPSSALVALAKEKGFFAAEGFDAVVKVETLGKTCLKHLQDGQTDFAVAYISPAVRALEANEELGILSELHSSTRATSILFLKNSGIQSPSDLAGKRVGVIQGTHGEFLLRLFNMANAIDDAVVKRVMATPENNLQLLEDGKADAVVTWSPRTAELLKSKPNRYGVMESAFYTEFSMVLRWREQLRESGPAVLRALQRAQNYYSRRPTEAQRVASRALGLPRFDRELWDKYSIRLGLSSVLKSMILEEYLYAFGGNGNYTSVTAADSHVRTYFEAKPLTMISPEAVWFK